MANKFKALGAYIFAGGFTVGVRKHFDVLAHFEDGPYGVATCLHNKVVPEIFTKPDDWPKKKFAPKVDFIYANPPCAPWSRCAGGRSWGWVDDPRLSCVQRVYQLLIDMQPDFWAWESVRGAYTAGRELVDTLVSDALTRGYHATALLVEGSRHGVAQRRSRFFLVFSKYEIPWEASGILEPTTVKQALAAPFKTETVSKTIGQTIMGKYIKRLKQGERAAHLYNADNEDKVAMRKVGEKMVGRPSFQWRRLENDGQSQTLTGGCLSIHPTKNRQITVEEQAALCGYPRGYEFIGSLSSQYAQTAQAVMPPVGEYLARMMKKAAMKRKRAKGYFEEVEIFTDAVKRQDLIVGPGQPKFLLPPVPPPPWERTKAARPAGEGLPRDKEQAPRPARQGIGYFTRTLLAKGMNGEKVLAAVKKKFPTSKATMSDIHWNKRQLTLRGSP